MKQLLIIAIALTSVNAFATRARTTALGNAAHLTDVQTVYTRPSAIFKLSGDYVNMETGSVTGTTADCDTSTVAIEPCTAQNTNAEAMIVKTMGDAKMGLSLGHQSELFSTWGLRSALGSFMAVGAPAANQQNPIELTYGMQSGDMMWAGTLVYSNYNDKLAAVNNMEKESSTGLRLGVDSGAWDGSLRLGLVNTVDVKTATTSAKFTGTLGVEGDVGYTMDSLYFSGGLTMAGFKYEDTSGAVRKYDRSDYRVSATNSIKKDGNEFFFGAGLNMTSSKETVTDAKVTSTTLPVFLGLEVEAASWLTLRGSVKQATLINSSKKETATTVNYEYAPGNNTTTVALGAGLKFNKLNFDGTLSTGSTQKVNSSDLMGQVGMSYWF